MMPADNEGVIRLAVNGHALAGEKRDGRWTFTCSYPDLAAKHTGATSTADAITDFMARALAGAVSIRVAFAELTRDAEGGGA